MRHHPLTPWLFLLVPLALYGLWVIYPTLATFYLSFTDWDGFSSITEAKRVGFDNYVELFVWDDTFHKALFNNLKWILVFITVPTTLGLSLALVLNQEVKFDRFLKISYYLPMVLAFVVIGLIWGWIYHPAAGLLNNSIEKILMALKTLGLDVNPASARKIGWLADEHMVIWAIIGAAVWRQVGYVMILYLAGLKSLDTSLIEAAKVDGAERWTLFRFIIFPLLAPVTTIVVVISIIDSLRSFDMVWVMTRGGPFHSSEVLANYMYLEAFNNYNMGYAAAIGVVLFLISIIFIGLYIWRIVKDEELAS
ncbi:MAG: sugar ABC transporter permease [Deinococcales bacterium]